MLLVCRKLKNYWFPMFFNACGLENLKLLLTNVYVTIKTLITTYAFYDT